MAATPPPRAHAFTGRNRAETRHEKKHGMRYNLLESQYFLVYNRARERPGYQASRITLFPRGKGTDAG